MKRKIYKFIKWIVIISFAYLFIFENKYNIDESIIKISNCKNEEVIYFKVVILIIISLIIMIIDKYINKDPYLDLELNSYIKIRPIRSITLAIVTLIMILLVITILKRKEILTFIIFGIFVVISRYYWILHRNNKKRIIKFSVRNMGQRIILTLYIC